MIGFIVSKLDIVKNIDAINILSDNILNNLVNIKQQISMKEDNLYKSIYGTHNDKEFIIYHLMMDFSQNIKK